MTLVQRKPGVTTEVVGDQAVLVPPSGQEVITLNAVGSLIWDALASPQELQSLTEHLLKQLSGVEPDEFLRDLQAFLRDLQENDLIEGVF